MRGWEARVGESHLGRKPRVKWQVFVCHSEEAGQRLGLQKTTASWCVSDISGSVFIVPDCSPAEINNKTFKLERLWLV